MIRFAKSPIGPLLDIVGQRYHIRPSVLAGMNPELGQSLLFDISIMEAGVRREAEAHTTSGNIKSKRASWPSEIQEEIRRQKRGVDSR